MAADGGFPYAQPSMRRPLTLLAIVAAGLAAGCGGGDDGGGDEGDVRKAAEDYLTAVAAGNGERACGQLTPVAQKEAVDTVTAALPDVDYDCSEAITELSGDLPPDRKRALLNPDISEVTIAGDSAQVRVQGLPAPTTLSRLEGDWKVARSPVAE